MSKVQMNLYEAISRLKVYEDRLKKFSFSNKAFLGYYTEANPTVGGMDLESAKKVFQGNYDSFIALRANVYALRAAIYEANISNKISIPDLEGGREMTLAEAVSRFNSLNTDITMITELENQKNMVMKKIENENEKYLSPEAAYKAIAMVQTDAKKKDETEGLEKQLSNYREMNRRKLLDPIGIIEKQIIENEKIRIQNLRESFNIKLMQADVSIMVEVELAD